MILSHYKQFSLLKLNWMTQRPVAACAQDIGNSVFGATTAALSLLALSVGRLVLAYRRL